MSRLRCSERSALTATMEMPTAATLQPLHDRRTTTAAHHRKPFAGRSNHGERLTSSRCTPHCCVSSAGGAPPAGMVALGGGIGSLRSGAADWWNDTRGVHWSLTDLRCTATPTDRHPFAPTLSVLSVAEQTHPQHHAAMQQSSSQSDLSRMATGASAATPSAKLQLLTLDQVEEVTIRQRG